MYPWSLAPGPFWGGYPVLVLTGGGYLSQVLGQGYPSRSQDQNGGTQSGLPPAPSPSQDQDRVLPPPWQDTPWTGYSMGGMPPAFSRTRTFLFPKCFYRIRWIQWQKTTKIMRNAAFEPAISCVRDKDTGLTWLILNDFTPRFSFELSGSSNYDKSCNSYFSKIFELWGNLN